jgi:hypothetical protein
VRFILPTIKQRVAAIRKETDGVRSQSGITQWDLNFLNNIEGLDLASHKQRAILAKIEVKVFGESVYQNIIDSMKAGDVGEYDKDGKVYG